MRLVVLVSLCVGFGQPLFWSTVDLMEGLEAMLHEAKQLKQLLMEQQNDDQHTKLLLLEQLNETQQLKQQQERDAQHCNTQQLLLPKAI